MNENSSSSSISWTGTKQRVGFWGATKPAILHTVREINEIGFRSIRKEPKRGHIGTFRWWVGHYGGWIPSRSTKAWFAFQLKSEVGKEDRREGSMAGRGDWIASDLRSRLKRKLLILIAKRESSQCHWVKEKRKYNTNKWMQERF